MANKKDLEALDIPVKEVYSPSKIIVAILVLVAIILAIIVWPKADKCETKFCFIDKADNCENAIFRGFVGDSSVVKYTTKDCILTKTIEEFSETEPQEVVNFFKNKEMTCSYTQGNFDIDLIEGLSIGMDNCEGELKDAILELRAAQLTS